MEERNHRQSSEVLRPVSEHIRLQVFQHAERQIQRAKRGMLYVAADLIAAGITRDSVSLVLHWFV